MNDLTEDETRLMTRLIKKSEFTYLYPFNISHVDAFTLQSLIQKGFILTTYKITSLFSTNINLTKKGVLLFNLLNPDNEKVVQE